VGMVRLIDQILGLRRCGDGAADGMIAHDDMGMSLSAIRVDALGAAGVILAAVSLGSLLARRKR
jgi:hypothetical protein